MLLSTGSPEYVAGGIMGLAEADGGFRTGDRAARRALTSSLRGSATAGSQDSIPGLWLRSGLLSADRQGTQM